MMAIKLANGFVVLFYSAGIIEIFLYDIMIDMTLLHLLLPPKLQLASYCLPLW